MKSTGNSKRTTKKTNKYMRSKCTVRHMRVIVVMVVLAMVVVVVAMVDPDHTNEKRKKKNSRNKTGANSAAAAVVDLGLPFFFLPSLSTHVRLAAR